MGPVATKPTADATHWTLLAQGVSFRQAWVTATAYYIGDMVRYLGVLYIARTDNSNVTSPLANPSDWDTMADPSGSPYLPAPVGGTDDGKILTATTGGAAAWTALSPGGPATQLDGTLVTVMGGGVLTMKPTGTTHYQWVWSSNAWDNQVVNDDSASYPVFKGTKARGTLTSPTPIAQNNNIVGLQGWVLTSDTVKHKAGEMVLHHVNTTTHTDGVPSEWQWTVTPEDLGAVPIQSMTLNTDTLKVGYRALTNTRASSTNDGVITDGEFFSRTDRLYSTIDNGTAFRGFYNHNVDAGDAAFNVTEMSSYGLWPADYTLYHVASQDNASINPVTGAVIYEEIHDVYETAQRRIYHKQILVNGRDSFHTPSSKVTWSLDINGNSDFSIEKLESDVTLRLGETARNDTSGATLVWDGVAKGNVEQCNTEALLFKYVGLDFGGTPTGTPTTILPARGDSLKVMITKIVLAFRSHTGLGPSEDAIFNVGFTGPNFTDIITSASLSAAGLTTTDRYATFPAKAGATLLPAATALGLKIPTTDSSSTTLLLDVYVFGIILQ